MGSAGGPSCLPSFLFPFFPCPNGAIYNLLSFFLFFPIPQSILYLAIYGAVLLFWLGGGWPLPEALRFLVRNFSCILSELSWPQVLECRNKLFHQVKTTREK